MIYNKAVIKGSLNILSWMAPTKVIEIFWIQNILQQIEHDQCEFLGSSVHPQEISSSPNAAKWIMYKKRQSYLRKNMQMAHTIRN